MKQIYILATILFINYCNLIAQTTTDVVTGLDFPNGLTINGNYLYISEYTGSKISKIDITASTPTVTDVITGVLQPTGIILNGNDLYISEYNGDKISKIDITATTPNANDVVTAVSPWQLIIDNDILYITESTGTVSKLNLNTLSLSDLNLDTAKVVISPNPVSEFVQVLGLEAKEIYKIYNILGIEIKNGIIDNQQQINIIKFTNGIYFLKLKNRNAIKFIKK